MLQPLAFSLTAFLMWISECPIILLQSPTDSVSLYQCGHSTQRSETSLLASRPTRRRVSTPIPPPPSPTNPHPVFINLHRVLLFAVIVIVAFFIISSLSFSSRLSEDFGPTTWQTSWILLDGWLGILYLVVFSTIAFLWRPTSNNQRLALSDELPTDEREADEFEVDSLEREAGDKDAVQMRGLRGDNVVFDVGDDEDEEEGVGRGGMGGTGESRPLRLETSEEDDEDEAGPPPSYKRGD